MVLNVLPTAIQVQCVRMPKEHRIVTSKFSGKMSGWLIKRWHWLHRSSVKGTLMLVVYRIRFLGRKKQWNHPSSNFVQFLHVNGNHWMTISNIGVGKGIVNIYDSLQMNPTAKTENLIAQFIKSDFSKLTFRLKPVQKKKMDMTVGFLPLPPQFSMGMTQLLYYTVLVCTNIYWNVS